MPLCARCSVPFVCTCSNSQPQQLAATAVTCPLDTMAKIWVHVVDDVGADVGMVVAKKDGTPQTTEHAGGTAKFDPVPPGPHTVELQDLGEDLLRLYERLVQPTTRRITVAPGQLAYVPYQLSRKPSLKVRVVEKGNESHLFAGATVTVTGPQAGTKPTVAGIADFGRVPSGAYKIKVKLSTGDEEKFATTLDFDTTVRVDANLPPGREEEVVVYAEPINFVKPKIEMEYRIVLFDRKLSDKQSAGEAKITPSATYIQATIEQTNPAHPYAKTGKLKFVPGPGNVDPFIDEACATALTADLTAEQLVGTADTIVGDKPPRYWLRGKTKGKFTVELVLADPADRFVKLAPDPPPPEKMGVVELQLKLHWQDLATIKGTGMQVDPDTDPETTYYTNLKNKALPDQKLMTDDEKIGKPTAGDAANPGRLLHAQNAAHFGRAKLIVAKIEAAQLPDEAEVDNYDIVLNFGRGSAPDSGGDMLKPEELRGGVKDVPKTGAIALYDVDFDGAAKATVTYKISALKGAEQTLWVEGTTETDQPCDVRLDAGMDRAGGGLAKTVKRNGDWTRYTVVKIEEVKLDHTATPGQADLWDAARKEYYVNLKADPAGRKIKIATKLTKPLKNVVVHFMLAPDKDNRKAVNWGKDMPGTWNWKDITKDIKHLDRTDRKDFLHLSEKTDADGKAAKELTLSRIGGDVLKPAAYIEQDAHLAKYADIGAEPDLKKREPVFATDEIRVSRKFWYQLINVAGVNSPDPGGAVTRYEEVKTRLEAAAPLTLDPAPNGAVRKKYMVRVNGGNTDVLVVTDLNRDTFFAGFAEEADKPIKVPVLIAEAFFPGNGSTNAFTLPNLTAANFPLSATMSKYIIMPPAQGGNLAVSGNFVVTAPDLTATSGPAAINLTQPIADADLSIDPARGDRSDVRVGLPANILVLLNGHPQARVSVSSMVLQGAKSLNGQAFGNQPHRKVVVIYNDATPLSIGHFPNTFAHELAHNIRQVQRPGSQPAGIPDHPLQYEHTHVGSHCGIAESPRCMMYGTGPNADALNRFCDACHPYLLTTDMTAS